MAGKVGKGDDVSEDRSGCDLRQADHDDQSEHGFIWHLHHLIDPVTPDCSGYVDEYRFVPLTPQLERALMEMLAAEGREKGLARNSAVVDGFLDEACELREAGFLGGCRAWGDGRTLVYLKAKARRYPAESESYRARRGAWARDRLRERSGERWAQLCNTVLAGFMGLIGAAIGAVATILATRG